MTTDDKLSQIETFVTAQGDDGLGPTMSFGMSTIVRGDGRPQRLPKLRLSFNESPTDSDFVVLEELGTGGVGIVELATQKLLNREVAIKRVRDPQNKEHVGSLLREAGVTGQLEHPNVIPVHAIGEDQTVGPFVAMKRVSGKSWADLLREDPDADHLGILSDVCQAIAFAHTEHVIHRDLKPDNVMVGEFGEVYVVDWGLALRDEEPRSDGMIIGTPAYMAPEMAFGNNSEIDKRSDVYLLGAILFEILEGRPPHLEQNSVASLLHAALNEPLTFTDSREPLVKIVQRACATERDERFADAGEFRDALVEYIDFRIAADIVRTAKQTFERAMQSEQRDRFALLGEARFGFERALEIRADVFDAQTGLDKTREELIVLELENGNVERAARLLEQMPSQPERLISQIEDARRRESERIAAEEKLREIEQQTDLSPGAVARLVLGVAVLVLSVVFNVIVYVTQDAELPEPRSMLFSSLGFLSFIFVVWFALRNRIPQTQANRAVIGTLFIAVIGISFNRLGGAVFDGNALQINVADLMIFGVAAFSVRKLLRHPILIAIVLASGAVGIMLLPTFGRIIYNITLVTILGWVVIDWNVVADRTRHDA